MTAPPTLPKPPSAYARSRLFRWGVWALICACALIVWGATQDLLIARKESLFTLEGVVLEQRSTETAGGTRVRLSTGGSNRIQGQPTRKTFLKVRSNAGGLIKEFTESEWYQTPKAGWVNQPIRVQYDALGRIYEIVVAGEVIRDAETTRRYRRIDNRKGTQLIVFLIVTGVPLTLVGYGLSLRHRAMPPPLP